MPLSNIILIGIGLSMDAVAVAMASGMELRPLRYRPLVSMALLFGFFQMIMPIIGWLAGSSLHWIISRFDHWVAFGLLAAIGLKMTVEAAFPEKEKKRLDAGSIPVLFTLAIATSIDALAVGLSFPFLGVTILTPALIIGLITFALSLLGGLVGYRFGSLFGGKIEIAGGLILIAIGCKILFEHLGLIR